MQAAISLWEVNIATGGIDEQFNSGNPGTLFGLVVAGQITAGGPPPSTTPEPGTINLLLCAGGVFAFGIYRRRTASRMR